VFAHHIRHALGQFAQHERVTAFAGDAGEHGGQFRVGQHMALGPRFALAVVEIGRSDRVQPQPLVGCQQRSHALADGKALGGDADRRGEQLGPAQAPVLLLRHREHAHQAGNTHRASADRGLLEGHGRAIGVQKKMGPGCRRRSLASIKSLGFFTVKVQQKSTATDAAALGFDHAQHHLHGNRRVHRAAPGPQDFVARLRGQRIGRRHGKGVGLERRLLHTGAGEFGLHRRAALGAGSAEPDQKRCEQGNRPQPSVRGGTQGSHFLCSFLPKAGFDCERGLALGAEVG
jgi:hypothetical protein